MSSGSRYSALIRAIGGHDGSGADFYRGCGNLVDVIARDLMQRFQDIMYLITAICFLIAALVPFIHWE
jgi:hypothetical protein